MEIAVIGTGYVGLVSGICYAEAGHTVYCVDQDKVKIEMLRQGKSPIYEPGIEPYIERNRDARRLIFTSDISRAVHRCRLIVLAVGTPSAPNGEADLQYIRKAVRAVGRAMNGYKIVATKSTVPVGTNDKIKRMLDGETDEPFDIVSMPEFLREGSALTDSLHPDRIVIGLDNMALEAELVELHRAYTDNIFVTDIRSAEMIKYASNAFLATKISFINEISNICEKLGADVTKVAAGMGMDHRIGSSFLNAGIGYGGSCFPKDTKALVQIAGNVDYEFQLLKSVIEVNRGQRFKPVVKLEEALGSLRDAVIGIWGLSFKPHTDDVREAPSLDIVEALIRGGAKLKLYDPVAMDKMKERFDHPNIEWCSSAMDAAASADAICLLTDWPEFKEIDLRRMYMVMRRLVLVDGRNVYTEEQIRDSGLQYYSVGRPAMENEKAGRKVQAMKAI